MEKITLLQAYNMAVQSGLTFSGNFQAVTSQTQAAYLKNLADRAGYKKFSGDKRSLAHCFFEKLQKTFTI